MDGFSYSNIFETKGIEYLIIIAFLLLIIPFWTIMNRKNMVNLQVRNPFRTLSNSILNIPLGIYYSKNHTWVHLEKSGNARVGLDDFLLHVTGEFTLTHIKNKGDLITKGELMAEISHEGKTLRIYSPLTGKIAEMNSTLKGQPGVLIEDPYGKAWVYKIKPSSWIGETSSYYLAEDAVEWFRKEITRFKDFMAGYFRTLSPENSMIIMQDGGELCDHTLSELPDEVWQNFEKSFLI